MMFFRLIGYVFHYSGRPPCIKFYATLPLKAKIECQSLGCEDQYTCVYQVCYKNSVNNTFHAHAFEGVNKQEREGRGGVELAGHSARVVHIMLSGSLYHFAIIVAGPCDPSTQRLRTEQNNKQTTFVM